MPIAKNDVENYLSSLGMGTPLIERGLNVFDTYVDLFPDGIEHVFVSEYRAEDGNRIYESFWLFSQNLIAEAHEFTSIDHGDLAPVRQGFAQVDISRNHFDLKRANANSRLTISAKFNHTTAIAAEFRASAENCEHLSALLQDYMIPKLT